ncbi:MAG TPA: hypothetical protein VE824_00010 [Gaiellales bacterium]|nr:hypothetical protein [Gaiellales bacterium]
MLVRAVTNRVHYAWVVSAAAFLPAGALGVLAAMLSLSAGRRGLLHPSPAGV